MPAIRPQSAIGAKRPADAPDDRQAPTQPQPGTPARSRAARLDFPTVRPTVRGDKSLALGAARSQESREEALQELTGAFSSASSVGPQASLLKTWIQFHDAWFEGTVDAFPLTVLKIYAVAAMLKRGGYRAVDGYLSRAKDAHLEAGFVWDDFLDRAVRRARRAATRGIGPARQSASFDLQAAADRLQTLPATSESSGVPVGGRSLVVAGAFWMLRELELSSAIVADVTVTANPVSVAWRLPVSKTDVRALGQSRKWDCLCAGDRSIICPAHAIQEQLALLADLFGEVLPSTPLFPNRAGEVVEKKAVVTFIETVATLLDEPLTDDQGQRRFGGHSLRVTGARHLASIGLEISLIQLMARWSSDVVLRYVAEAPLEQISRAYVHGRSDRQLSEQVVGM